MSDTKNNRNKWLHIRMTEAEYKKIKTGLSGSTKQKISSYIRDIVLDKPITVYTRSKSVDDFVTEMIQLRNELRAIGNNINQAVKKLHTSTNNTELKYWAEQVEKNREILFEKMEQINTSIAKKSDQWSQE